MSEHFADRLLQRIANKGAAVCVGIDPVYEMLPDVIAGAPPSRDPGDFEAAVDAIFEFTTAVIRIVAPHVPCVKFQSACFEKYLWEGVESYYSLIQEAEAMDLLVIGDVKRGDIGTTAAAYAEAHLADPPYENLDDIVLPDAITVNPYMGMDTLEPFVAAARAYGKGLFVVVRSSNPGSADLQDAKLEDGRTFCEMLADRLREVASSPGLVGDSGYSAVGAVVGATQPHTMTSLRQRLPQSIFLLPGYGAQGATAEMTRAAFVRGQGAIVSASRSILYAYRDPRYASRFGEDWQKCIEQAVLDMKREVAAVAAS